VVSEIANNFFSQAINGIECIAYNRGCHVTITQSHESREREKVNVEHLAAGGVDGLLVALSSESIDLSYLKDLHEKGLPIVFFDRITDEMETHKVTANNHLGAFHATEHLIYEGDKKIAHITSSPCLSISKERLDGYKAAREKHKIPFSESVLKYCNHGRMIADEVEKALNELFKARVKPDAIFTAGDRLTIVRFGILKRMKQKKEVGFTGFTNSQVGDLFAPALTVVRPPAFEKRSVIDFEMKILETELIVRESSKKGVGQNIVRSLEVASINLFAYLTTRMSILSIRATLSGLGSHQSIAYSGS
jgi:LacI family transcriptional regulator